MIDRFENHPFDGRQYVVMRLTAKTWYEAHLLLKTYGHFRGFLGFKSALLS